MTISSAPDASSAPGGDTPPAPPAAPPAPSAPPAPAAADAAHAAVPDWVDQQAGPEGGRATRHLQAAAHLSPAFRRAVIEELVEERHRVPAPTPGADPAAVLAECLRARRHTLWTALACTLVLLVGLAFDALGTGAALGEVVQVLLLGAGSRAAVRLVARVEPSFDTAARRERLRRVVLAVLFVAYGVELVFVLAFLAAAAAVSDGSDGSGLGGFAVSSQPSPAGAVVTAIILILCWVLIGAVSRFARLRRLAEIGDPASAEPPYPASATLRPVFERLRSGANEAETVFGAYQPFVGSGVATNEWSLQTELRPASVGAETVPITVTQVHEIIAAWLRGLSFGSDYPGDALHALTVRDRVFRSGLRVDPAEHWLGSLSPAGPDGRRVLDARAARVLDDAAHPRLRHYLEARAELWNGQLVVSTFVRVTLQGHQLYLEGLEYLLPPVAEGYRLVDQALHPDGVDMVRCLWAGLTHIGRDLADNTGEVASAVLSGLRGWWVARWRERMLAHGRKVDQAPRVSVRELGADDRYEVLFQYLDAHRVWSAVGARTQAAVIGVLKQNGYSTEQFEAAVQNININNGIQNYDSTVSGAQAVGRGARASSRVTVPKARMGAE